MSDTAIEKKFMTYAGQVIGDEAARKVAQLIWKFEALADVRDLLKLCA